MPESGETIDWEAYWAAESTEDDAWVSQVGPELAGTFEQLFEVIGTPDSVASIGCGPAVTLLELAESHPDGEFHGYDVASSALERAREERLARDVDNATFARGGLPDLDAGRRFELVYSVGTLHYVADTEAAIGNLWAHVAPGGHLAVNYPTPVHRDELMPDLVDSWEAAGFEDRSREWVRERFSLVLSGESVLTEHRVGEVVGQEPRDVRSFGVELPEAVVEQFRLTVLRKPSN